MPTLALLGYPLSHSFSQRYFTEKFAQMGLADTYRYLNFEVERVDQLPSELAQHPDLIGYNVTIPYKQAIIPFLDAIDPTAARIGAVNTVSISEGKSTGYNTDYLGFYDDLRAGIARSPHHTDLLGTRARALILGTGGSAKAVREALNKISIEATFVSRRPKPGQLTYADLSPRVMGDYRLIVNTTPLGMHPHTEAAPNLPYAALTPDHFCYDLIYNPAETLFLKCAKAAGAGTRNGMGMLIGQAEAAWKIWQRTTKETV